MKRVSVMMVAIAFLSGASSVAWATNVGGDAARGENVFKKCAACHTLEPSKHRVGPTLLGVFGRLAGSTDGYKYSTDMKAAGEAGLIWSEKTLVEYIKKDGKSDPKAYIGSVIGKARANIKMAFPGLRRDQDIADLIAFLKEKNAASN